MAHQRFSVLLIAIADFAFLMGVAAARAGLVVRTLERDRAKYRTLGSVSNLVSISMYSL